MLYCKPFAHPWWCRPFSLGYCEWKHFTTHKLDLALEIAAQMQFEQKKNFDKNMK